MPKKSKGEKEKTKPRFEKKDLEDISEKKDGRKVISKGEIGIEGETDLELKDDKEVDFDLLKNEDMLAIEDHDPNFKASKKTKAKVKTKIKPIQKKTKTKSDIDREISEIYENEDGSIPDMKHFQKKKHSKLLTAFLVLSFSCLLLAAVAWLGFFVIQPSSQFSEKDVILSISGDEKVSAGQEVRYRVRYRNGQSAKLSDVALQIRYPEGFVFTDSSQAPDGESNNQWKIEDLGEYDSGYIDIYGNMYGALDQEQSLRVFLNYTPANFSSLFQKATNVNVEVTDTPVLLSVEAPNKIVAGAEVDILVKIEKVVKEGEEKEEELKNLAVIFEPDENFVLKSSDPESDQFKEAEWSIDSLEEVKEIKIRGVFNSIDDQEEVNFSVKLLGWKDDAKEGEGFVYAQDSLSAEISKTDLSASLAINGTVNSLSVQPGEFLNSSIVLKNVGDTPIEQVRVRAIFEAPSDKKKSILNWVELRDEADGNVFGEQLTDEIRRGTITWNKSDIRGLSSIDSDEQITIDFGLPVKSTEDADLTEYVGHEIKAILEVQYESGGEQQLYTSSPMNMMLNSDLVLEVRDEIISEEENSETHNITWLLSNSFHDLKDIELSVDIYGDISFNKEDVVVPAGEIEYNEESKKLIWRVPNMPTTVDVLALQFPVKLNSKNPSQTNLTSKVNLQFTDVATGEKIFGVGDEVLLNVGG